MTSKEKRLARQARASARWRGHSLRPFQRGYCGYWAQCRLCDCGVAINANPPPNGIEIGGDAVAITCEAYRF